MNFKEKIISCCIAVIIPTCGISQNKLIPSVELGLSFSQFPSKNTIVTWQISDSTVVTTKPVLGPSIGISAKLHLTEHLKFIFGCSYQLTGTKTYSYSQSTESHVYPVSFFKDWLDLKIHKVCVPVTLGYEFNLKKIKPIVFLGVKPNLILSAKLHEKSFHSQWTEPVETTTNLFSEKADYRPPKRIINQLSFGFIISIRQNLKVNLSYNLGHNHFVNTYWIRGNYSRVPSDVKTSIKSSDYILSLQYDFIKPE
jgi:hypothetical protein